MRQSTKQQWIVLAAAVLTLMLGAVFAGFQAMRDRLIWPLAILLGLVWGPIGIWMLWRARRRAHRNLKISDE
jgi:hypothetical protein